MNDCSLMPFRRAPTARCCCHIRGCSLSPPGADRLPSRGARRNAISLSRAKQAQDRFASPAITITLWALTLWSIRMLQMAGRMQVLGTETAFEVLARANALAAQG